jgi:beta-glucanase (GH16 family)
MHPSKDPNWEKVFSDEFESPQLNSTFWDTRYFYGRTNDGNNELQYYTPESVTVADGKLRLTAINRATDGFRPVPVPNSDQYAYNPETFKYQSGMISSHDKRAMTYGYMEIRAKMPAGQGLWSAFWTLPQSKKWPPEISISEILGKDPNTAHSTLHFYDASQPKNQGYRSTPHATANLSTDFHTFAARWEPGKVTWYIDDVEVRVETANVPSEPMYLLANLAVGAEWPGYPDATTPFPSTMEIDYIRVYQDSVGTLHGGTGSDTLQRQRGTLSGEAGDDNLTVVIKGELYGGFGDDRLTSQQGSDRLVGDAGDDILVGGGGVDDLNGSNSVNRGLGERDILTGGAGRDRFILGDGLGSYYQGGGKSDHAQIRDLAKRDRIDLATGVRYRAIRDKKGFDLYAIGSNNSRDLVADVWTKMKTNLPQGVFQVGQNQSVATIFWGV